MSTPSLLAVDALTARRFQLAALGLASPHPDVAAALVHHGYIQIDPLNICGRMQDLILRVRVAGYREGDLLRHLHGPAAARLPAETRTAFEHHVPSTGILVAFPLDAWPHLLAAMQARTRRAGPWSGRLTPRERALAPSLLTEIAARGPLGSADFDDPRRARRVWGASTLVKATLQKLFFHGRLLIATRDDKGHRRYDLPERVLPAATLARPTPPAADTSRWLAVTKLHQRRLVRLTRAEHAAVADLVQPVRIADSGPLLHVLRTDSPLLEACTAPSSALSVASDSQVSTPQLATGATAAPSSARLLAPLEPLIYDRVLTAHVWGFDYTWEAYTPVAKRVRGHYALPLLVGTELVGHIDPKADRPARRLRVQSRAVARGHATAARAATHDLAHFLGLCPPART